MRTKIAIFLILMLGLMLGLGTVAGASDSKTIFLNRKNFVYVVFDAPIQDIIYDSDGVEDERSRRKDMIGLRLAAAGDTAPIGCLVVMEGNRLQHLWLRHGAPIQPVVRLQAAAVTATAAPAPAGDTAAPPAAAGTVSVKQERDSLHHADRLATARSNARLPEPMRAKAQALLGKAPTIYQLGGERGKVSMLPQSIGVDATHLYLAMEVGNTSNVDYYIDIQGFQIDYKRRGLAAGATGKEPLPAVGSWNEPQVIRAQKRYKYILVYELFTLKKNQSLEFFIRERNGGRNVDVEVPSKYLYENTYPL